MTVCVHVQKDPGKSDDFHGERGAGDADTIEVVSGAGGADDEQADGDQEDDDKTA